MNSFNLGEQSYKDYLKDISGQIHKTRDLMFFTLSAHALITIASQEALIREIGDGFNRINNTIEWGFGKIENALYHVETSIGTLIKKLDAVHRTLENPTLTQAREFYRLGSERFSKGLLDKALEAFLEAEKKNDTDFFIQLQLGKLYLYGLDEDDDIVDLKKAETHLRLAIRYGKAELSILPNIKRLLGETFLHASIACYVQANDYYIKKDTSESKRLIKEACNLAQQGCKIYPHTETYYHLAKFSALLNNSENAINNLEKAILDDRKSCLKASTFLKCLTIYNISDDFYYKWFTFT